MPEHHHRAGSLRQSNKRNKRSKSSKRSISRNAGGKVVNIKQRGAVLAAQCKADRRNTAQQKRDAKRQELMNKKRSGYVGGGDGPSRIIGIVSLGSDHIIEDKLRSLIMESADKVVKTNEANDNSSVSCKFEHYKKDGKMTLLTTQSFVSNNASEDVFVLAALDLARVCDMILFVIDGNCSQIEGAIEEICFAEDGDGEQQSMSTKKSRYRKNWDHLISRRGDLILSVIKAQGLPTPVTILANTEKSILENDGMTMQSTKSINRANVKRRLDLKKYVCRFATTEFGHDNDKVLEVDLFSGTDEGSNSIDIDNNEKERKTESLKLVRTLCTMACSPSKWISSVPRTYLVSDSSKYIAESQELELTGYIRGNGLFDVNMLVHIPTLGTFACKSIRRANPPLSARNVQEMDVVSEIIHSNPEMRDSLNMFATPDGLEGEQNLIGFDENLDTQNDPGEENDKIARPLGWSDYQVAWLDAIDDKIHGMGDTEDHGEMAQELNRKGFSDNDDNFDDEMDLGETQDRRAYVDQRKKQRDDELNFPDEVQVGEDEKALERFARYRSLKSFRQSQWDPKENLPETYSNIYHITNFKQTQSSILRDMKELIRESQDFQGDFWNRKGSNASTIKSTLMETESNDGHDDNILEGCVPSGSYVTLTIENVKNDCLDRIPVVLTAVSLLEHENKVSVLHAGLTKTTKLDNETSCPIKSKDVLIFRCGWRTWKARPIFSQNNLNCDKHKFERFLPPSGAFFAASVFGPVTYTPCPVLVFREQTEGNRSLELVAIGSMMGADADRIIVKRIVLTGYPVRVHKRYATVKYMFNNPDDVKWFKPAGLHTKHGLQGNIIQSVGEHGTMKCLFDAPIKQHDTVCLPLYKRLFPKYALTEESDGRQVLKIR